MARGSLGAVYLQEWQESESVNESLIDTVLFRIEASTDDERWDHETFGNLDFSIGYGRVRDATGVYQAHLLADRLERDGRLARPISASARAKLARLFFLEPFYRAAHDQPTRFFWRDVERIMREDGAVGPEGLDAFATLHATERVVLVGTFRRPVGYFAGPLLRLNHRRFVDRTDRASQGRLFQDDSLVAEFSDRSRSRMKDSEDAVMAGVIAEFHRPIGIRHQLDVQSLALFDLEGADAGTLIESRADYRYLVGERWFANAFIRHARQIVDQTEAFDVWFVEWGAGLSYYLEDRWSAGLALTDAQRDANFSGIDSYQRGARVVLSIGYRRGLFEAPGLIDPVRSLN